MTCKDAIKLIHQILDGEASDAALADLSAHTDECSDCAEAWETMSGAESLLREARAHEPDDAYFDGMAREISARVYERQHSRKGFFGTSWIRSFGMAAACLAVGLFVGRAAFPVQITDTVFQDRIVEVPGPVEVEIRTVEVPTIVEKEVPVEVVVYRDRWRTRTVVEHVSTPATQPALMEVAAVTPVAMVGRATTGPAIRVAALDTTPTLSADDLRALAAGLAAGGLNIDDAIHTTVLASALATGMSAAEASVDLAAAGAHVQ